MLSGAGPCQHAQPPPDRTPVEALVTVRGSAPATEGWSRVQARIRIPGASSARRRSRRGWSPAGRPPGPRALRSHGGRKVELVTWTEAGQNDGFLARRLGNGNVRIDDGRSASSAARPHAAGGPGEGATGFRPLAAYDSKQLASNENLFIDSEDQVFLELRVWIDRNHNGRSEPGELVTLPAAGIHSIEYGYGFLDSRDEHGNVIWLEGRAWSNRGAVKVYDVIFLDASPESLVAPAVRLGSGFSSPNTLVHRVS